MGKKILNYRIAQPLSDPLHEKLMPPFGYDLAIGGMLKRLIGGLHHRARAMSKMFMLISYTAMSRILENTPKGTR